MSIHHNFLGLTMQWRREISVIRKVRDHESHSQPTQIVDLGKKNFWLLHPYFSRIDQKRRCKRLIDCKPTAYRSQATIQKIFKRSTCRSFIVMSFWVVRSRRLQIKRIRMITTCFSWRISDNINQADIPINYHVKLINVDII